MVDLSAADFEHYTQLFAIWLPPSLSVNEAWVFFRDVIAYFAQSAPLPKNFSYLLSVENGSLIGQDLDRIDLLAQMDVQLLNPVWAGRNQWGGAWDTEEGLTAFGIDAVNRCFEAGIVPDLSHASDKMAYEILSLAAKKGKPVVASHSCARSVFPHRRNLTDDLFRRITETGGIVGLSFYPGHLCEGSCTIDILLSHMDRFLSLGGENALCIGADWDGIECTPMGLSGAASIPVLAEAMAAHGYPQQLINKILWQNASNFFSQKGSLPRSDLPPKPDFT